MNRRNLLNRHLKPTIKKLELPTSVDFRSFRTMHSSLMSSIGVRPEVTRDNMGHSTVDVTQNVYNRTWWEEQMRSSVVTVMGLPASICCQCRAENPNPIMSSWL